jgi:hypothetical protein
MRDAFLFLFDFSLGWVFGFWGAELSSSLQLFSNLPFPISARAATTTRAAHEDERTDGGGNDAGAPFSPPKEDSLNKDTPPRGGRSVVGE